MLIWSCESNTQLNVSYSGDLEIGKSLTDSLQFRDSKFYDMTLDSNLFIYGIVQQMSVDVIVKLYGPDNNLINSFDGPARGPELFSFDIKESGKYKLEVMPFQDNTGVFTIELIQVEPLASSPEKRIDQLLTFFTGNNPGAVVGVIIDGDVTFSKAFGKANMTHNVDFTINTPSNIGSVSKQFTAMAILLLEKERKLSLEDDVRKYIPEIPDFGQKIAIKNLLNHTNGLREVYNLMPISGWKGEDVLLKEEVLEILTQQPDLQASPGEEYNYNNSAFIMLAEIVERLTDQEFPEWMKENIFEPLGMENTVVRKDPTHIIPNASQGYSYGENGLVEAGDLYAAYGAGGMYSTVGDIAKWMNNFKNASLGGDDVLTKLVTPGILNNGDTMNYALGLGIGEYKGKKRYSHGGADIAHRAMMVYFPEINSGVVTLSNHSGFSAGSIAYNIADLFFKEYLSEEEKSNVDKNIAEIKLDPEKLKKYTGKYKAESIGLIIEYKVEDDLLVAYPIGQSSIKLKATSDTTFKYTGVNASLLFKVNEEGECTGAIHTQNGSDLDLDKLPPFEPSIDELNDYIGTFFSKELTTFYTLVVKDSSLIAEHRNLKDIKLTPNAKDTFTGDVYFMTEVSFKRNSNGSIFAFTVSNGRTKNIFFEKQ